MTRRASRPLLPLLPRFEAHHEPLLPRPLYAQRLLRSALLAGGVLGACLGIGVLGYHGLAGMPWLDALVNAAMILGGMGPVDPVRSAPGKWFAASYALFAGVAFLSSVGVLVAPVVHRFLHRFHLEDEGQDP